MPNPSEPTNKSHRTATSPPVVNPRILITPKTTSTTTAKRSIVALASQINPHFKHEKPEDRFRRLTEGFSDGAIIFLKPSSSLIEFNWERPGDVLMYLVNHPEERQEIMREAVWRNTAGLLRVFLIYHPVLQNQLVINASGNDRLFIQALQHMLFLEEGILVPIFVIEQGARYLNPPPEKY